MTSWIMTATFGSSDWSMRDTRFPRRRGSDEWWGHDAARPKQCEHRRCRPQPPIPRCLSRAETSRRPPGSLIGPRHTMLSVSTRRCLERHVERALRQRSGASSNLREVIREVVIEMAASGDSAEAVRSTLTLSVQAHPERYRWDRVSIVTGLLASDVLTRRMLQWAEQPKQSRRARRPSHR